MIKQRIINIIKIVAGCALFALSFNLFLEPNNLNVGGISGISMALVHIMKSMPFAHLMKFLTVGLVTAILNIPLFALAGIRIGKSFFWGSLLGMLLVSGFIDLFAFVPAMHTEPLLACLYGGLFCGLGAGLVFSAGASTGGSDIIVRYLKKRWPNTPIGSITIGFDLCVAVLTGIAFQDPSRMLYSGVTLFVAGKVVDAVVYRFDYSKVVFVITEKSDEVAKQIGDKLRRGATFLHAEGAYQHHPTNVILTAVKRSQLAELKQLVVDIDENAFIIVQEAHQVLGDGFCRYNKDAL